MEETSRRGFVKNRQVFWKKWKCLWIIRKKITVEIAKNI